MATRTGTSHFVTKGHAYRYYAVYGTDRAEVDRKIKDGEIHVGRPAPAYGEEVEMNSEGRYFLVEKPLLGQNRHLLNQMMASGYRMLTGYNCQHFVDSAGKFVDYPAGFITGPSKAIENGSGKPWYISVNGPNGWRQRSGSYADIESLKRWAIETQTEILKEIDAREDNPVQP